MYKILWDFEIQIDHLITAKRSDLVLIHKTETTCYLMDFAVPTYDRRKMKEREKVESTREVKKQPNMKMTVIPIVVSALGKATIGLEKRLEEVAMFHIDLRLSRQSEILCKGRTCENKRK